MPHAALLSANLPSASVFYSQHAGLFQVVVFTWPAFSIERGLLLARDWDTARWDAWLQSRTWCLTFQAQTAITQPPPDSRDRALSVIKPQKSCQIAILHHKCKETISKRKTKPQDAKSHDCTIARSVLGLSDIYRDKTPRSFRLRISTSSHLIIHRIPSSSPSPRKWPTTMSL